MEKIYYWKGFYFLDFMQIGQLLPYSASLLNINPDQDIFCILGDKHNITMTSHQQLSKRGFSAAQKPMRVDLEIYYKALENTYHPIDNPEGSFPMNMAENHLCWDMLRHKIESVTREKSIPDWVSSYGDPAGVPSFREATAAFLSEFFDRSIYFF